jgi:hypothetical protein
MAPECPAGMYRTVFLAMAYRPREPDYEDTTTVMDETKSMYTSVRLTMGLSPATRAVVWDDGKGHGEREQDMLLVEDSALLLAHLFGAFDDDDDGGSNAHEQDHLRGELEAALSAGGGGGGGGDPSSSGSSGAGLAGSCGSCISSAGYQGSFADPGAGASTTCPTSYPLLEDVVKMGGSAWTSIASPVQVDPGDDAKNNDWTMTLWLKAAAAASPGGKEPLLLPLAEGKEPLDQVASNHAWRCILLKGCDDSKQRMPSMFFDPVRKALGICVTTRHDWNKMLLSTSFVEPGVWYHLAIVRSGNPHTLTLTLTFNPHPHPHLNPQPSTLNPHPHQPSP